MPLLRRQRPISVGLTSLSCKQRAVLVAISHHPTEDGGCLFVCSARQGDIGTHQVSWLRLPPRLVDQLPFDIRRGKSTVGRGCSAALLTSLMRCSTLVIVSSVSIGMCCAGQSFVGRMASRSPMVRALGSEFLPRVIVDALVWFNRPAHKCVAARRVPARSEVMSVPS